MASSALAERWSRLRPRVATAEEESPPGAAAPDEVLSCVECGAHLAMADHVTLVRRWGSAGVGEVVQLSAASRILERGAGPGLPGCSIVTCAACGRPVGALEEMGEVLVQAEPGLVPRAYNGRELLRRRPLRVLLCTLTPSEHEALRDQLERDLRRRGAKTAEVRMERLRLGELRRFDGSEALDAGVDLVLVAHLAEGRVLLLDRDGLYNQLMLAACRATGGSVAAVLTGLWDSDGEAERALGARLADPDVVAELAEEAGQSSVYDVCELSRFYTCAEELTAAQLDAVYRAARHELPPLVVPEGVTLHAGDAAGGGGGGVRRGSVSRSIMCSVL